MSVKADSSSDGGLQLNPNVITKSNGGIGSIDDFPEVGNLFVKKPLSGNSAFTLNVQTDQVRFGIPIKVDTTDYSSKTSQLFKDYHPQLIVNEDDISKTTTSNLLWIIIIGLLIFPVIGISFLIGRSVARRRLEKQGISY